ncbi:MAG: flagellar export chaperone FliS [Peptococcaceae bacterium]|nr:flagellar export chaperone FliS [Peptococcaceae bacterium]
MANVNPYQQYQQNFIKSAGRGELTLILYDGAVRFIKQGIKSIEENKIQSAHDSIVRAQEIISHLNETLNTDYELSGSLTMLYDYINRRLMEANIKKDRDILGEALGFVSQLRDTWKEALKLSKAPMASGQ